MAADPRREANEERYRALFEGSRDAIYFHDLEGRFLDANPAALELLGYRLEEIPAIDLSTLLTKEEDVGRAFAVMEELLAGRPQSELLEFELRRKDGEHIWVEVLASLVNEGSSPSMFQGIARDVTDRKKAEDALRASEDRYRTLVELVNELVWTVDTRGVITYMSPGSRRIYGREPEEMVGRPYTDFVPAEEVERGTGELAKKVASGEETLDFRNRVRHKDGHEIVLVANVAPLRDAEGRVVGMVGSSRDVTAQEAAEAELRSSEARFRTAVMAAPFPIMIHAGDGEVIAVNEVWTEITGYGLEDIPTIHAWTEKAYREDVEDARAYIESLYDIEHKVEEGRSSIWTKAGERRTWVWASAPLGRAPDGRRLVLSMATDVTESEQADAALRLQAAALNAAGNGIVITDREGTIQWVNEAFAESTGYSPSEAIGKNPRILKSGLHDGEFYTRLWRTILAGDVWRGEVTNRRKNGALSTDELTITPVKGERGEPTHFVAIQRDLTEVKLLQAQFLQAQKMETVGRLAGGIAHDFNNLLTVINGTADLAASQVEEDSPLRAELEEIKQAGERAASLTRQLLAFSRRQVLQPEVVDLGERLAARQSMLRRLIGEDITLDIVKRGEVGSVRVDPSQIDQVILNLVVNARDAMPEGGKLTIELADVDISDSGTNLEPSVEPGPHVVLTVRDTGVGMDEATRELIFEPFFTTKEPEKGTGLGLAMVYGTVAQSGGGIRVDSEPGRGTTFEIYFPRLPAAPRRERDEPALESHGGTETVLLVEDEDALRRLAERVLDKAGYTVLAAANAAEARAALERHHGPVHLVFTDVVLPEVSGRALATEIAREHPGIKTLYTSGYTDDVILKLGVRDHTAHFLPKPYSVMALKRKVREVLGS